MRAPKTETEIRREQITEAAFELVGSQGISSLTVEKIATMIGVVPSALYKHFKNKQQILDSILDMIHSTLEGIFKEACQKGRTPLGKIHLFFLGETRFMMQNPEGPMILMHAIRSGKPSKRLDRAMDFGRKIYVELVELLRKGQEIHEVRSDIPAENMGLFYFAMTQQIAMAPKIGDGKIDVVKHIDYAWQAFAEIVRSR